MDHPSPDVAGYKWIENPTDYCGYYSDIENGIVPIVRPKERDRIDSWSRVLRWYGLEDDKHKLSPIRLILATVETDPIVVMDRDLELPGRIYAAYTGRPCYVMKGHLALAQFVRSRRPRSLLILEKPSALGVAYLQWLHQTLTIPWGILTGKDTAALSFVVAKLIAKNSSKCPHNSCLMDMMASRVLVLDETAEPVEDKASTTDELMKLMLQSEWDRLAISAHGSGAHAYLSDVTLCGLTDREEVFGDDIPVGGCTVTRSGAVLCRSAPEPAQVPVQIARLKAKELYLYSCTSFSVSREYYPSSVSLCLSAAEGYPHSILATYRIALTHDALPYIALRLRAAGTGLGMMLKINNDLTGYRDGHSPFVLMGDPCDASPMTLGTTRCTDETSGSPESCDQTPICNLDHLGDAEVVSLEGESDVHLVRGRRFAGLVMDGGSPHRPCVLLDATQLSDTHFEGYKDTFRRLRNATRMEHAVRWIFEEKLSISSDFLRLFNRLTSLRLHLESTVYSAIALAEEVREAGVYSRGLRHMSEYIGGLIAEWDSCFAEMLPEHVFDRGYDRLFSYGCVLADQRDAGTCGRCGNTLTISTYCDPVDDSIEVYREDCPICGIVSSWTSSGATLEARVPSLVHPGGNVEISLLTDVAMQERWAEHVTGVLAVKVYDGWGTSEILGRTKTVRKWPHIIRINVPQDTASELWVLSFCWIAAMDFRFRRSRIAVLPNGPRPFAQGG